MKTPNHPRSIDEPAIKRGTTGRYSRRIEGFWFMGGKVIYNSEQDTLTASQMMHATVAMFGWPAAKISKALGITPGNESTEMSKILKALDIRNKGTRRLGILTTCLAAQIITIDKSVPKDLLPLEPDELELVRDLADGQTHKTMAANRRVSPTEISDWLIKLHQDKGLPNHALLMLGTILTEQLVVNPLDPLQLESGQEPVQILSVVKHFPNMPELATY